MTVRLKRALNGQVCGEHGWLSVFGLFQFMLGLDEFVLAKRASKNETGKGLSVEDVDHGFIGLLPNGLRRRVTLHQIGSHAHVLASLTGIHVYGLCLCW